MSSSYSGDPRGTPDYQHVMWEGGKPYWLTDKGVKIFIPPMSAAEERGNPDLQKWAASQGVKIDYTTNPDRPIVSNNAQPQGNFFQNRGTWNQESGDWDQGANWGNIIALVIAGAITAGAASAMTGAPVSAVESAAASGGSGATSGGAGATLASMAPSAAAGAEAAPETALLGSTAGAAVPTSIGATTGASAATGGGSIADMLAANQPQMIPNSLATTLTPGELAVDAPGSTIGKVLGSLSKVAPDLSSSLGSLQQGIQNNRLQTGSMAAQYDNALQAAQTGRNQTESDALKKLAQTSYILSGGFKPNPNQTMQLNGQTRDIQNYGMAPLPSSDAQKAGAQSLQDQLGARLKPGGTATPLPFSDYGTPGTGEKLASAGAGITSMLPTVKSIYDMFTK